MADDTEQGKPKPTKKKGLLVVNTGEGKGKTTAALGVFLWAWRRDMKVGGIQFFKNADANFGEIKAAKKLGIELIPMGDGFTRKSRDLDETQAKAVYGSKKRSPAATMTFSYWTNLRVYLGLGG